VQLAPLKGELCTVPVRAAKSASFSKELKATAGDLEKDHADERRLPFFLLLRCRTREASDGVDTLEGKMFSLSRKMRGRI
jgi:hypothetical protein